MHPTLSSLFQLPRLAPRARMRAEGAFASLACARATNLLLPSLCFVVALASFNAAQQPAPPQADMTIDAATRTQVIEETLRNLREAYVSPEVATRMEQSIRERVSKKEYEGITSAKTLARTLTEHLQAVSRDKHLRVNYRAAALAEGDIPGGVRRRVVPRAPDGGSGGSRPAGGAPVVRRGGGGAGEAAGNLGLEKVETLGGNVGLLDFSMFDSSPAANAKISEAMNRLSDTDALIIDLRRCRGGARNAITLLMSYLFDKSVHLSDAYDRISDSTDESWSHASVPGRRYAQKDVYILTSSFTFSAAEDVSYTLKNLKRATIVGETTGGGAHPVTGRRLNDHFFVMVPYARYVSPITKTNWEGVGVEPDIKTPAAHALKVAHLAVLKKIDATGRDATKAAPQLKALIETLQKELDEARRETLK
ncbi:MAG TPA: S41 family peptidase [Pyrinomonadaceae bacterium]|nr:S41 family peptidase [Pyrinomonadaceae bacterium]